MAILWVYVTIILFMGLYATIITLTNLITIRRQTPKVLKSDGPLVSVLVPARNEEEHLRKCIASLTKQDYRNMEIIVLDDNSTDATWSIIQEFMESDPRVKGIKGQPLPQGWKGKIFAMKQLEEAASGEYILFTDADTVHTPKSVSFGYSLAEKNQASLVSGYPYEHCNSWSIGTIVAAMEFNMVIFVPLLLQSKRPSSFFAMAIGQYLFIKSKTLQDLGGFSTLCDKITDDVNLARLFARNGYKNILVNASDALSCNMYGTTKEAFRGMERSVIGVLPRKAWPLIIVAATVLFSLAVAPLSSIALWVAYALGHTAFLIPAIMISAGTVLMGSMWTIATIKQRYSVSVALSGWMTFLWICMLYVHGLYRTLTHKGVVWKGRKVD